jgi:hypothetical protein
MFEELMRRLPELDVIGPAGRASSSFVRGIAEFPGVVDVQVIHRSGGGAFK